MHAKLPSDVQEWYDVWRDKKNKEIRKTLRLFQQSRVAKLRLDDLSDRQKILVKRLLKRGFMSYDLSLRRGFVTEMYELISAGWIEQDRRRRWMLTLEGATLMAKTHT